MNETAQLRVYEPTAGLVWVKTGFGLVFSLLCNVFAACVTAVLLQRVFASDILVGLILVLWPLGVMLVTYHALRNLISHPLALRFVLANIYSFILLSALWLWQYHFGNRLNELIDRAVAPWGGMPWGWIVLFFAVCYFSLRRVCSNIVVRFVLSTSTSALFSFSLWFLARFVFSWIYDPNY
jgi:hypothetical protein